MVGQGGIKRAPAQQGAAPQQQGGGQYPQRVAKPNVQFMQDYVITKGKKPSGKGGYNVAFFPTLEPGKIEASITSWAAQGSNPKFSSLRKVIDAATGIELNGTIVTVHVGDIKYDLADANLAQQFGNWNPVPRQPRQQQSQPQQQGGAPASTDE